MGLSWWIPLNWASYAGLKGKYGIFADADDLK